ncbi:MAG: hypothetical protein M5U19_21350 [Microthrixaceae bacterium]|nr:hypothetical protein [Microthrixaceae bacterium]
MADARGEPSRSNHLLAVALGVGAAVVLMVGVAVLLWAFGSDAGAAVAMVPASDEGADPFTDSVQIGAVPRIEPEAAAPVAEMQAALPLDEATTAPIATGTAPGLYGGSGESDACDPKALVGYLDEHSDKAAAWSDVLGISVERIEEYVAGLTPVVLTTDTLVTNHGFRDGHATELPSVLQAGTAVMVDDRGVPRVKCNCGNPLTEPEPVALADVELTGDRWADFDPGAVVTVRPGEPVDELTLCNLRTGERYTRPVGSDPSGGSPPPNLDGTWTITLTRGLMSTEPLPAGEPDPEECPNAGLNGATMVIEGRRASLKGVTGVGDLSGTIGGAPAGSEEWLVGVQRDMNGAVIRLGGTGGSSDMEIIVATGGDEMYGGTDTVDERGIGTGRCHVGVVIRRSGTGSATTTTAAPTTTTTLPGASSLPAGLFCRDLLAKGLGYPEAVDYWRDHGKPTNMDSDGNGIPCETVYPASEVAAIWGGPPPSTAPSSGSGGACDQASLQAAFVGLGGGEYRSVEVSACNGKWATLLVIRPDLTEDYPLLEWTGSAWQGGACERYRDPNDWTRSSVVPPEFWGACIVD